MTSNTSLFLRLRLLRILGTVMTVSVFVGCGGGGGGSTAGASSSGNSGPVASASTFAFSAAWKKFLTTAYTKKLIISGSCSGSLQYTHGAVSQPTSFSYSDTSFPHPPGNVNPGYFVAHVQRTESTLSGCPNSSSIGTNTVYYDATTFAPFGYVGGTAYNGATSYRATFREFSTAVVLPDTVKVGDKGRVGTINIYGISNFKKDNVSQGRTEVTFEVEADSSTTALINIISRSYDTGGVLLVTDQTRYRIDTLNELSIHSIDQEIVGPPSIRLLAQ
jgi:hypothetical protein